MNATQAALFTGAGRALVRSCARLLGLGHAVAHKVIFFFFLLRGAVDKTTTPSTKGMSAYVETSYIQSGNITSKCFVAEGLAVCLRSERCTAERGTEAFKGNNLPPQRSNCDICTSVFSCDTLSLQLLLSQDNNPL